MRFCLDRDRSNQVDSTDFYIIIRVCMSNALRNMGAAMVLFQKVREIYGAESKQMEYARNSLTALWNGLVELADKNRDSKIEVGEWVTVLKSMDPKTQAKWFTDYSNYMFKLFDVSEDDKLDLAEYADGMITYGFKEADAHEAFKKLAVVRKPQESQSERFEVGSVSGR